MTADRLLAGVKRRIVIPASQSLLLDADILAMADDEIKASMVPLLTAARQDYFVTSVNVATVADQESYAVPYRAVGRGLRDLKIVDSAGLVRDVGLVTIEDAHRAIDSSSVSGFFFKGDSVVLVPAPADALSSIQFWY